MRGAPELYLLPVLDINGADDPCLERLDGLGAAGGDDLARRDRHNIDFAEAGPAKRKRKNSNDRPDNGPADRRRRRVGDFERRGQEGELGPGPLRWLRGNDIIGRDFIKTRLDAVQRRVAAAGFDELVVGAVFDEPSLVDGEDAVARSSPWRAGAR